MGSGIREWVAAAFEKTRTYFGDPALPGFVAWGSFMVKCPSPDTVCQLATQLVADNFPRVPWQYNVPAALDIEEGFRARISYEWDTAWGAFVMLLDMGDGPLPFVALAGSNTAGPPGSAGIQIGETIWQLDYDPDTQQEQQEGAGLGPNRYYLYFHADPSVETSADGIEARGKFLFVVEMGWPLPNEDTLLKGLDRFVTPFEFIKPKPPPDYIWETWGVTPFGWTSMSAHIVPAITHPIVALDEYVWHNVEASDKKVRPAVSTPSVFVVAPCDCILFSIEGAKRHGSGGVYYDYTVRLALTPSYALVVFHLSLLHTYEFPGFVMVSKDGIGSGKWGWPDWSTEEMGLGKDGFPAVIPPRVADRLHNELGPLDYADNLNLWAAVGTLIRVPRGTVLGWAGGDLAEWLEGGSFDQGGFDLSGTNYAREASFVNPTRYPDEFLQAESPLQHFTSSALNQYVGFEHVSLFDLMRNLAGSDTQKKTRGWWGRFCWENGKATSGYLIGNWFEEETTPDNFMEEDGRRQLSIAPDWEFPEQIDITIGNSALWLPIEYVADGKWSPWPGFRTGLFRVIDLLGNSTPNNVWWEDYRKELGVALVYKLQEQRNPLAFDDNWYRIGFLLAAFTGPDTLTVQMVAKAKPSITEVMPPVGFLTPGFGTLYWASEEHEFQR
jgi:hypothetical protein